MSSSVSTTASLNEAIPSMTSRPTETSAPGPITRTGTSAALYLYTFLATLFLLLTVSAVIVIRSFILRRRHRRLVEEAIRNGTWVPPPQPFSARTPRVDLSKKPVMWEAYLGGNEKDVYGGSYGGSASHEDVKDWDTIKPVSAAYLAPRMSPDHSGAFKSSPNTTPVPATTRATSILASGLRAIPRHMWSGFRWMAGYQPDHRSSSDMSPQNGASGMGDTSINAGPDGGPPVVRVAVIIAMPQPAKPTASSTASPNPTPSTSALSPANSHPLQHQGASSESHPPDWDEDEPLPVMEMGVAELVMVGPEIRDGSGLAAKASHGRDSSSIRTVEV
ncbi:hypothetical protein BKA70DRAFT_1296335 [Coprinopsis sp. MPI-PUGE-AT-0042]|nr:hypothetical protein BKA70DRAFT_1296335 [Coprinopsis sp. MPI-PUGE-AT-0042]